MNTTKLFLSAVLCLGAILFASCKNQKAGEDKITGKTEHFAADLPDGEYLVDSSDGIKTYAIVQAKKLIKFRASNYDGSPSKNGIVIIRAKMQQGEDDGSSTNSCDSTCRRLCVIDIDTGNDLFCNCLCTAPVKSELSVGMMHTEILGPSFGRKKVKEVQTRIIFEIDQ